MGKRYSTTMTNVGGRTGKVTAPDDSLTLNIAPPGAPGAPADATNPEQLFAAGYSACFNGALALVMRLDKVQGQSTVTVTVSLYENERFDFSIGVEIEGHVEGVPLEQAQQLMDKAHQVCPYSKATRGNIEVSVKAV